VVIIANAGGSIGRQWAAEFIRAVARFQLRVKTAVEGVLFEGEGWYSAGELITAELPAEAEHTSHKTHRHIGTRSGKKAREERGA
jgi:hypothetical protein